MDVNIIPEFLIAKTAFPGNRSFGGVVDFLLTKLPEKYTGRGWNCLSGCGVLTSFLQNFYSLILRGYSVIRTKSRESSHQTYFLAKRDNVRAALPQAVIAAASHCKQHKYLSFLLMSITLQFLIVTKFTGNARLYHKRRTTGVFCL
jgi:hypothetical protein